MKRYRRTVMWFGLVVIMALVFLSIYGAFVGSERAQRFFNTIPLTVYWFVFILLLAAGFTVFRRLVRVPGLLLIHAGCILVLAGSMWASQAGHKLQKKLFGIDKITKGRMIIFEGRSENHVITENGFIKELPFQIKLKDFETEYYKPAYLQIHSRDGQRWRFPVEAEVEYSLGPEFGTMKILQVVENFRITIEDDKKIISDDPGADSNPALVVRFTSPEGEVTTQYAFERFPGHSSPGDKFLLGYHRVISEYISRLEVVKEDKTVAEKDIEVNHPLHFGGYHFYQHDYDKEEGRYTILSVTSDTGLAAVYAGYWMLGIGVFLHLWLRHIFAKRKPKVLTNGN
ncbi:MAG: cytochrome c biogenesis protein ResB [Phycisphaerales bacterium]